MINKLKEYDAAYYNDGTSSMSDKEYDDLKDIAKKEYPDDPYFLTVGSSEGSKVKLPYILGSLNKVKPESVDKWLDKYPEDFCVSQKLDGVSIFVRYNNGGVEFACTRGDGEYGKDITNKARIFCKPIKNRSLMELRGEAMLLGDTYKDLGFKTARNGVAGILNRDETDEVKHITPYFYELIQYAELRTVSEYERFVLIESLGLKVPEWTVLKEFDKDIVMSLMNTTEYEVDGVVLTVNENIRENVKYPDNKVAYKVQGKSIKSRVKEVKWNVGRTGRIIPVVIIDEVEIGGAKINRTTGFNAKFINDNYIVKGTDIEVVRSGDVIPYITKVNNKPLPDSRNFHMPRTCPSCGGCIEWKGVDLICTNDACNSRVLKKLEFFLRNLGVENITTVTLEKLGVFYIEDLYDLNEFEIAEIEGFGIKSGEMIVNEINKTLNTTQEKLLASFGIPGVGKRMSKNILKCFGSIEKLFEVSEMDLQECDGVGPKIARNIMKNIIKCWDLYDHLVHNVGMKFINEENNMLLENKKITLTGKGEMGRKELQAMIELAGGTVSGISKTTDYLVTNDINSQSGKMKKAREYDIQIISYEDLMDILEK
jgi:DNA ligase (NAD+)